MTSTAGRPDLTKAGVPLAWASMGIEIAGIFLAVNELVVVGSLLLIVGVAMAVAAVRLVPEGESGHTFVVGALKTTVLLLGFAVFLLFLVFLEG